MPSNTVEQCRLNLANSETRLCFWLCRTPPKTFYVKGCSWIITDLVQSFDRHVKADSSTALLDCDDINIFPVLHLQLLKYKLLPTLDGNFPTIELGSKWSKASFSPRLPMFQVQHIKWKKFYWLHVLFQENCSICEKFDRNIVENACWQLCWGQNHFFAQIFSLIHTFPHYLLFWSVKQIIWSLWAFLCDRSHRVTRRRLLWEPDKRW